MDQAPVRRQQRGLDRIESILDAAAETFASVGYARATTNAIATAAGISPGSLYQFFTDKADIARALAARWAPQIDHAQTQALAGITMDLTLDAIIDRVVDPLVEFKQANPAFLPLFARQDLPPELAAPIAALDEAFERGLVDLLHRRGHTTDCELIAHTSMRIFKGLMFPVGPTEPDPAPEMKVVMRGYLIDKGVR
jgi:AcrR family transcriptional regulator